MADKKTVPYYDEDTATNPDAKCKHLDKIPVYHHDTAYEDGKPEQMNCADIEVFDHDTAQDEPEAKKAPAKAKAEPKVKPEAKKAPAKKAGKKKKGRK